LSVTPNRVGLNDFLFVEVRGFAALKSKGPIVLYLNGRPAPIDEPVDVPVDNNKDVRTLRFRLENTKTDEAKKFWNDLFRPLLFYRKIDVNVGHADQRPDNKNSEPISLIVVPPGLFCLWLFIVLLVIYVIWQLGRRTNLLRASGLQSQTEARYRYSLGKTQMAFWFVIVLAAFSLLWIVTGQFDMLTTGVVALMGISATTGLGAVAIDATKQGKAASEIQPELQEQVNQQSALQEQLDTENVALEGAGPDQPKAAGEQLTDLKSQLEAKGKEIDKLTEKVRPRWTQGFWKDVLSDANGISLHRLQIVAWTIMLGIVFAVQVYRSMSMPEFNETLLALMGVSSGAYIGFKFPEKEK
jgi:hypothetical protein